MEIKITTTHFLKFFEILSWFMFIGLCIESGGLLFNTLFTFFHNPNNVHHFWYGIDFSNLYNYDKGQFVVQVLLILIVSTLKIIISYLVIKILRNKNFNFTKPFNYDLQKFITNTACLSFGIGLFSKYAVKYTKWLVNQGVEMPNLQNYYFDGFNVWIFMGIILVIISKIFKRGIEIQAENDLTI